MHIIVAYADGTLQVPVVCSAGTLQVPIVYAPGIVQLEYTPRIPRILNSRASYKNLVLGWYPKDTCRVLDFCGPRGCLGYTFTVEYQGHSRQEFVGYRPID